MEDFIVTVSDIRKTGHCVLGIRRWFALHNLNFEHFLTSGIPASVLLDTEDALAIDVVTRVFEAKR